MNQVTQTITLKSDHHYGRRLPPEALGPVLVQIPLMVRQSISMAFRGRSTVKGPRPQWLESASDIRFMEHSGKDESILTFQLPTLGEAAPELYRQQEFWSRRPDPDDTGFDLFGDVLADVDAQNEDSDRYDPPLLSRLVGFRKVLNGSFRELDVASRRYTVEHPARLAPETILMAERFYSKTPTPQRVRVVGILDMIKASTQTFALRLDDGQEVRGVLAAGGIDDLAAIFRQRVLVLGKVVYRASGRLLRIDAESVTLNDSGSTLWSKIPRPGRGKLDLDAMRRPQGPRSGVAAILGRWPGNESDEQVREALEALS